MFSMDTLCCMNICVYNYKSFLSRGLVDQLIQLMKRECSVRTTTLTRSRIGTRDFRPLSAVMPVILGISPAPEHLRKGRELGGVETSGFRRWPHYLTERVQSLWKAEDDSACQWFVRGISFSGRALSVHWPIGRYHAAIDGIDGASHCTARWDPISRTPSFRAVTSPWVKTLRIVY